MNKPKAAKVGNREKIFEKDEIRTLIAIWSSVEVQEKFSKGMIRHTLIYEEVAAKLRNYGYNRSAEVVKKKINNLKSQYNIEKRALKSGASPSTWEFWDVMHHILGSRPLQNTDLVEDSLSSRSSEHSGHSFHYSDNELSGNEEVVETSPEMFPQSSNEAFETITDSSVQSPSGWEGSCSSVGSSNVGKERIRITRKAASKRPASDNVYLKQLVDIDKRYLELTEARSREDALAKEERSQMMQSATQFFKAFASLAELEVKARRTPSTSTTPDWGIQSQNTEPLASLNLMQIPKPSTFSPNSNSTIPSSMMNQQPKFMRLTQAISRPSQQQPIVASLPVAPVQPHTIPAARPTPIRYILKKTVIKPPPPPPES